MITTRMKLCTKCNREKPLENFNKKSSNNDGLDYWCKDCVKIYRDDYKRKHNITRKSPEELSKLKSSIMKDWWKRNREITPVGTKRCTICNRIKPLSEFSKKTEGYEGTKSWCKHCCTEYNKLHYPYKSKSTMKPLERKLLMANRMFKGCKPGMTPDEIMTDVLRRSRSPCVILKRHEDFLKNDNERLTVEFLQKQIRIVCDDD